MSKKTKLLLISGALVLVLLTAATNIWIKNEIKTQLARIEGLHYRSLQTNPFTGRLRIKNISGSLNGHYLFSAAEINISGFSILTYLLEKSISANAVSVEGPVIRLNQREKNPRDKTKKFSSIPVTIDSLQVSNGSFIMDGDAEAKTGAIKADFKLALGKLSFDYDNGLNVKAINVTFHQVQYSTPDSIYQLLVKQIQMNDKGDLDIDSVRFCSIYGKYEQSEMTSSEKDWINITIPGMKLTGLDLNNAFDKSQFGADKLIIDNAACLIFRDKNLPSAQKSEKLLPHQALKELDIKFSIDTIQIKSSNVTYEEHAEGANRAGKIYFNDLHATLYDLTNIDSLQALTNYTARMEARSKVMGKELLQVSFIFPLAEDRSYQIKGHMGGIDLKTYNQMLEPTAFLRIENGRQIKLNFDFVYDDNYSEGEMNFQYEGLEIRAVDTSRGSKGKDQAVKSFIANTFFIENKNHPNENDFRVGKIKFERDKQKSLFNYWWKSLLSGFKSSTGIKEKKE